MDIIQRLDLEEYLKEFETFFARPKGYHLIGDLKKNFKYLQLLEKKEFTPPPPVENLDRELIHLKKFGILTHSQIFQFIKIVNYFKYLKSRNWEEFEEWFGKIEIPKEIEKIGEHYNSKGEVIGFPQLAEIGERIKEIEEEIRRALYRYINSRKLEHYLVDRQIHLSGGEEALLLRGGFHHILKGDIVGRSSGGFFYVVPATLKKLKEKKRALFNAREEFLYQIAKEFSQTLRKWVRFLEFINREFDKFDQLQARVFYAKAKGYQFFLPTKTRNFRLREFCHPSLRSCVPINLEWEKQVLIITGVNAGGKTMLLKSILTSAFLGKHLLPMKAREGTQIPLFREVVPIITDPQNSSQDISTFAGRIQEFSQVFKKENGLLGVDEIELGTDANEASILFKVVVEELMKKHRIVITTHHKRLASLLANNPQVELLAAVYDEKRRVPTYQFIKGTIGKSYAFETAQRYGIPFNLVTRAKREYSDDLERLDQLIERSTQLEFQLKRREAELEKRLEEVELEKARLAESRLRAEQALEREKERLQREFGEAIKEAKRALKARQEREFHRHLNRAHSLHKEARSRWEKRLEKESPSSPLRRPPKPGEQVRYRNNIGELLEIKGKWGIVEIDGKRVTLPLRDLELVTSTPKREVKIVKPKPTRADVSLDLHGLRLEEALEKVEEFLNNAVLAGFDEVVIYHGVGKGILAKGVKELLERHPLVKSFENAPPSMGGIGAKIVRL